MTSKTFRIITLGCRTNQYESAAYRTQLEVLGYREASTGEPAEICIVNTCTVTENADRDSKRQIRRVARENPGARIVVTGCLVEQQPELVQEVAGIAEIVPNKEKELLLEQLFPELESYPEFKIERFEGHTRAFVKVQDGCNSYCTYCIIPYVRGRSRSRTIGEVVAEVEGLIGQGYKEIVLTGINIGDFDGQGQGRLVDLVRSVDQVEGLERLRISSIDPDEVDDPLLEAVIEGKHTAPSMHIVLQAGSNVVLKRMNRKYTRQDFFEAVDRLQSANRDFTFTTDVIVGFPGESERDFEETLEVMREVRFAKVHMFPYSERPRTRAALYPHKVSGEVIQERKQRLLRQAEQDAFALREGFVGRTMTVLTEACGSDQMTGHTENFLPVQLPVGELKPNQLVGVELTANTPKGLVGAYAYPYRQSA